MMCPATMGVGQKLFASMIVMSLGYFVMVTAAKQTKILRILGTTIGIVILLLTGIMFAKTVIKKCAMSNSGKCPVTGMTMK